MNDLTFIILFFPFSIVVWKNFENWSIFIKLFSNGWKTPCITWSISNKKGAISFWILLLKEIIASQSKALENALKELAKFPD